MASQAEFTNIYFTAVYMLLKSNTHFHSYSNACCSEFTTRAQTTDFRPKSETRAKITQKITGLYCWFENAAAAFIIVLALRLFNQMYLHSVYVEHLSDYQANDWKEEEEKVLILYALTEESASVSVAVKVFQQRRFMVGNGSWKI